MLTIEVHQTPDANGLCFVDWRKTFGGRLASAKVPALELGAPKHIAIPLCHEGTDVAAIALDRAGERIVLQVPGTERATAHAAAAPRPGVTVVVTSCGRQDLLERTLDSFFAFNTAAIDGLIVVEDGRAAANLPLMRKFRDRPIRWIGTAGRVGQIAAIDLAYAQVESEAIFHMEDDWEFYAPGFIEKSAAVLRSDAACLQVWIRALDDTNGHPLEPEAEHIGGIDVRKLTAGYLGVWSGFSFNPGLRRTADYRRLGRYADYCQAGPDAHGSSEAQVAEHYQNLGMYAYILADNDGQGYVRHIGDGRTVGPAVGMRWS
jgi:hypothetical protein